MKDTYSVILVYSTNHAIYIEKLLNEAEIQCKLVPVPRQLSSDCGVCVRFYKGDLGSVNLILSGARIEVDGIYEL